MISGLALRVFVIAYANADQLHARVGAFVHIELFLAKKPIHKSLWFLDDKVILNLFRLGKRRLDRLWVRPPRRGFSLKGAGAPRGDIAKRWRRPEGLKQLTTNN